MMRSSDSTDNLLKALVEAAPELTAVQKTKENAFAGYRYVTLDALIEMLRKVLPKHGLWFVQMPSSCENSIELRTRVIHTSGEWIEDSIMFGETETAKTNATQKIGSSITYYRRYALSSIFGIAADEDTDGADVKTQPAEQPADKKPFRHVYPKMPTATAPEQSKGKPKRDPVPYLMALCGQRMAEGETKESILRDFAEILRTDQIRDIDQMSDDERSYLARVFYKKFGDAPTVQVTGGEK